MNAHSAQEHLVVDLLGGGVEVRAEDEGSVEQMASGVGDVVKNVL